MNRPFFTIGHSNRSLDRFIELLRESDIGRVVDVRRMPGSKAHSQFDQDALSASLDGAGIAYEHVAALGGRRGKADVPPQVNAYWTNRSFHNYADYALTAPFRAALVHLLDAGHASRCAVMCSEAVWWRCHRRIVADHLLAAGESVVHILGAGRVEPARLTPGAEIRTDGAVVYPASDAGA
ncbi:DUF488 domain-containing protein [Dokdonella sp.]|uniref:DUF488 domain-containing protein n=1 Tax=Dokdonella sp. TaxID=2291710 RepID=UPI002F3E9687